MKNRLTIFLTVALGLLVTTTVAILIARGYTVDISQKVLEQTGMALIQSTPKEAKIYLNEKLVETTNAVLGSLTPQNYQLKIEKEGFSLWEKEITIFEGLITEIDALLIPTSPQLTPLTSSGIGLFAPSPQGDRIAYTTRNANPPGIWVLDISNPSAILNIIQENPRPIAADTRNYTFSLTENIAWSPKGDAILATLNPKGHVILDLGSDQPNEATSSAQPVQALWNKETLAQKIKWAKNLKVPLELFETATAAATQWSEDRKKFLFSKNRDDYKEWHVYNGEKPLGIGRQREYVPLKFKSGSSAQVSWHQTSNHLLVVEQGAIGIVEIDGGNRTEIYSGTLTSPQVIPTPDGTALIILTSFKQNGTPNLYAIGLR